MSTCCLRLRQLRHGQARTALTSPANVTRVPSVRSGLGIPPGRRGNPGPAPPRRARRVPGRLGSALSFLSGPTVGDHKRAGRPEKGLKIGLHPFYPNFGFLSKCSLKKHDGRYIGVISRIWTPCRCLTRCEQGNKTKIFAQNTGYLFRKDQTPEEGRYS